MQEFGFELALCAHLEAPDRVLARQLGAHVHGRRIVDTLVLEPGPDFADRAAITGATIPAAAIEADVGPGTAVPAGSAVEGHPDHAADVRDRAVEVGFFERECRGGRTYVRQATRYPEAWFDRLVGVENKPDLGNPGALETQLRTDVSLALLDEVVLATASHVTGAHLNRIPEAVGVWEFDPATGEREVVREATALPTDQAGVEILDRDPARAEVRVATAAAKARARRRLAERAYGKGWRTFDVPACGRCVPTDAGLPACEWAGRVVRPATECGTGCEGHAPADPPAAGDPDTLRDRRSAWVADPEGRARQQAGLERFSTD